MQIIKNFPLNLYSKMNLINTLSKLNINKNVFNEKH